MFIFAAVAWMTIPVEDSADSGVINSRNIQEAMRL